MFNPMYGIIDGFATQIYRQFGGEGVIAWDFVSQHPLIAIAVPMIWQWTPFMMLIILAGLQSQAPDILEAAAVDGADSKQIFARMTFPHLRQYIQLSVILGTIYIVQSMDFVFTITQGGPGTDCRRPESWPPGLRLGRQRLDRRGSAFGHLQAVRHRRSERRDQERRHPDLGGDPLGDYRPQQQ